MSLWWSRSRVVGCRVELGRDEENISATLRALLKRMGSVGRGGYRNLGQMVFLGAAGRILPNATTRAD